MQDIEKAVHTDILGKEKSGHQMKYIYKEGTISLLPFHFKSA
jgi:hypothetical protein